MPIASPARQVAPAPQTLGPAALAAAFLQFLLAAIAYATNAIDQMVPRTQADHDRLRRMRRALSLARAMVAIFGAAPHRPAPPLANLTSAQVDPGYLDDGYLYAAPAPGPWAPPAGWRQDPPRPTRARLAAEPPPFPGAIPPATPHAPRLSRLARPRTPGAARLPHSAHDPPGRRRRAFHHPSRRRALPSSAFPYPLARAAGQIAIAPAPPRFQLVTGSALPI